MINIYGQPQTDYFSVYSAIEKDESNMRLFLIVVGILVVLLVKIVAAWFMANTAVLKGHGQEVHAFWICFWLGIVGYIYVAALPDKIQQSQNQRIIELLEKGVDK